MPISALTLLVFLSGSFVRFSESWDVLYKGNLLFHPAIGSVWAVAICWNLRGWFIGRKGNRRWILFWGLLSLLAAGVIVSAWTQSISGFWIALVPATLLTLGTVVRTRRRILLRFSEGNDAFRGLVLYVVLLLSATGALILVLHQGRELLPVFALHAATGTGLLLLLICLVLVNRFRHPVAPLGRLLSHLGMGSGFRRTDAALLAAAGAVALLLWAGDGKEEVRYTFHLSTTPLEKRKPHQQDSIPENFRYAHLMTSVDSCGSARGCHDGIVEDHRRSSHNRSIQTSYFQTNLEFMAEEIGEHNTHICAGCHFPNAYFLSGTDFRDYADADGWSCVYCHTVEEVLATDEKGKTVLKLNPNVKHLKMFAGPDGKPGLTRWNEYLINLNPRGHGRVFQRNLYAEDAYCQVCHDLQIKPSETPGFMKAKCIHCHMQGRKWMGKEGDERNHFFPGTNLAGPHDLGDTEAMRINSRYSRGELDLPPLGWGGIWNLIPKEEREIKENWLLISIEPLMEPEPGKPFAYRVLTTNTSLDHAFPAAPLDLIEVWLETRVTDTRGRTLFQSGVLDEKHHIPPDTHKLGGYMIGMDNHLVTKNRVWQIKKKVIEREIRMNEQVEDLFSFPVPEDAVGPLKIYVSWNYRKLNQEFVDWAYNHNGTTVPILRIAEISHPVGLAEEETAFLSRRGAGSPLPD